MVNKAEKILIGIGVSIMLFCGVFGGLIHDKYHEFYTLTEVRKNIGEDY